MQRRRITLLAAVLVCGVACSTAARPDGPRITYRTDAGGGPASSKQAATAVAVIARRLDVSGLAGISVSASSGGGEIEVVLPKALTPRLDEVRRLVERNGQLEFRIRASEEDERRCRSVSGAGADEPPAGFSWVPARDGGPDMLVLTPERPFELEFQRLRKQVGDSKSSELTKAHKELDRVQREDVFRGDHLSKVEIVSQAGRSVVRAEFREARKSQFAAFTAKHVGEQLAIILDGRVEAAPVLKSGLPGELLIDGPGPNGYTEQEAKDIVTVVSAGSTGLMLHHVSTELPK